jgi:hypothetical protein
VAQSDWSKGNGGVYLPLVSCREAAALGCLSLVATPVPSPTVVHVIIDRTVGVSSSDVSTWLLPLGLLIVTAILAWYTGWLFRATANVADKTSELAKATVRGIEIQNELLQLETSPVLVMELGSKRDQSLVNHWTMIYADMGGEKKEPVKLGGYIAIDQITKVDFETVTLGNNQTRNWVVLRIMNAGRAPVIRAKFAVTMIWNTVRLDPSNVSGATHEQHMVNGQFDVPGCASGGVYWIGLVNQTGLAIRLNTNFDLSLHRPTRSGEEHDLVTVVPVPIQIPANI